MVRHVSEMSTNNRRNELADVLMGIVAERGLDAVSVREVAAGMGCSIGAVQHHFSTKAEMLTFAFTHSILRTRRRLAALVLTGDQARDTALVLEQLLPLDDVRRTDAKVNLAFSTHAVWDPVLQAIQAELLDDIRTELCEVLGPERAAHAALLLALVDGLALHELSAPGSLGPTTISDTLGLAIDVALAP